MSQLKEKLERIATGETHNPSLVQAYLKDLNAQAVALALTRLSQQKGRPAKHPPSSSLPMLD